MTLRVKCPACGTRTVADKGYAGQRGPCRQCGKSFVVARPGCGCGGWIMLTVVLLLVISIPTVFFLIVDQAQRADLRRQQQQQCTSRLRRLHEACLLYTSFKPEEPAEDSETSKIVNPPAVTIAKPQPKPVAKPENSKPSATAAPVETAPVTTSPATATPSAKVAPETTGTPAARVQTVPVEPELSAEMLRLRSKLRRVLGQYYMKPDDTTSHSPWGVMHAFLPFGVDTDILDRGERKNAIAFLAYNGMARGRRLLYTRGGAIHGYQGPGVQGHAGQFLAMLAQSRVKITYPLVVGNEQFTVKDLSLIHI